MISILAYLEVAVLVVSSSAAGEKFVICSSSSHSFKVSLCVITILFTCLLSLVCTWPMHGKQDNKIMLISGYPILVLNQTFSYQLQVCNKKKKYYKYINTNNKVKSTFHIIFKLI